ncbi:MAG: cysteine desulfurase family protein [Rhodospirillaceae bacterium]|nr:cysteine desulfurase family protein [Rhodospirillaceae bacterium]
MTRSTPIYLDYNATTPVSAEAKAAMTAAMDVAGNPSSIHRMGRAARALIEDAREAVAALVKAKPADVIFTSGGTEANALALKGLARAMGCVGTVCSTVEHPSVLANMSDLDSFIAVDTHGIVDLGALETRLKKSSGKLLVSVMFANNETGVLQPIAEVVRLTHGAGGLVHCDAIQAAGKTALDMAALGVDALSLSAHKFGGPKGVGALVLRSGMSVSPLFEGGGQEKTRRSGTENVIGIAGFGAAARDAGAWLAAMPRIEKLRDGLEARLVQSAPSVVVHGRAVPRLANTSCLSASGVASQTQVMQLDLAGLCVSTGSACSSGKVTLSHVLKAMGVADELTASAIRVSLGPDTTEADVNAFLDAYGPIAQKSAGNLAAAQ